MFYIQSKSLHFNLNRWCSSTTSSTNLRCEVISKKAPNSYARGFSISYKASGPPISSCLLSLNFQTLFVISLPSNYMRHACHPLQHHALSHYCTWCMLPSGHRIQTTDFTQPLPASHHSWDGSELLKFLPCSQLHDWHPQLSDFLRTGVRLLFYFIFKISPLFSCCLTSIYVCWTCTQNLI